MFQKGDLIVYGNTGVCKVEDVGIPQHVSAAQEGRQYYTLTPVHSTGTIYAPVDSPVFMRKVITPQQAMDLIASIPHIRENPCRNRDQKLLAEHYRSLLQSHDCQDLVQLIKTVYLKQQTMNECGKKPGITDMQYRKRAEILLHGELSAVLGIPLEEIPQFIQQQLKTQEKL